MRLQKFLATAGIASRRKAEELIRQGEIKINGRVHTEMGYEVKPKDLVTYQGKPVKPIRQHEYWAFFKPGGIVSTVSDPEGRKTVMAFYKGDQRVYPVGRLDYDSEGLMILTTDGDYAHKMMHPKFEMTKVYLAELARELTTSELKKLRAGVVIDDYQTRPIKLQQLEGTVYQIELKEGRNRQIRKMLALFEVDVIKLRRIRFGKVQLGKLKPGQMRPLTKEELRW